MLSWQRHKLEARSATLTQIKSVRTLDCFVLVVCSWLCDKLTIFNCFKFGLLKASPYKVNCGIVQCCFVRLVDGDIIGLSQK